MCSHGGRLRIIWRELGQRPQRTSHVQQRGVGVDVHGEVQRRVPHGSLSRPWRHAVLAQMRAERVSERVDVQRASYLVALGDACCGQVAVEYLDEVVRYGEQ